MDFALSRDAGGQADWTDLLVAHQNHNFEFSVQAESQCSVCTRYSSVYCALLQIALLRDGNAFTITEYNVSLAYIVYMIIQVFLHPIKVYGYRDPSCAA